MDDCQVLPGGVLLGPLITPMTAEEEAAARKRVAATLERIAARKQPEQKSAPGIERVAALLRAAPPVVRTAWILNKEFTRITLSPGWVDRDDCCCCCTEYPPQWMLGQVKTFSFFGREYERIIWTSICGPNGGPIGEAKHYGPC